MHDTICNNQTRNTLGTDCIHAACRHVPREAPVSITTISFLSLILTVDWWLRMGRWIGKVMLGLEGYTSY
jgi:hypothetical protein